jgi:glycosyltransferase involved in cell wall biosynthesis
MKNKLRSIVDGTANLCGGKKHDLFYIVENANWSIHWDGAQLCQEFRRKGVRAKTTTTARYLKNKVLHFGSLHTFLATPAHLSLFEDNCVIVSVFHVDPNTTALNEFMQRIDSIDLIHTSAIITKKVLVKSGVPAEKIKVTPLGVDTKVFSAINENTKQELRKRLNLPLNTFIIGSFQKDGNGWKDGNTPKWVKAPDVLCDVIESVAERNNIHVLLTGPARGYVKNRLDRIGIRYTHSFIKNYHEIAEYYRVLDCYLITSRAEGGPKAILESMACGISVVSTKVGMAPELIKDGENGFLCAIDDMHQLTNRVVDIMNDSSLAAKFKKNSFRHINNYSWQHIAEQYKKNLYPQCL